MANLGPLPFLHTPIGEVREGKVFMQRWFYEWMSTLYSESASGGSLGDTAWIESLYAWANQSPGSIDNSCDIEEIQALLQLGRQNADLRARVDALENELLRANATLGELRKQIEALEVYAL